MVSSCIVMALTSGTGRCAAGTSFEQPAMTAAVRDAVKGRKRMAVVSLLVGRSLRRRRL
jgi:hypothetical protein